MGQASQMEGFEFHLSRRLGPEENASHGTRARLAGWARVRGQKFEVFRTSSPELWIAPFGHVSRFARHGLWLLADFFSILLKVVRDTGKEIEGATRH